jgi:hypothetical protein
VEFGLNVNGRNPAVGNKTGGTHQHHKPKQKPEHCERCNGNETVQLVQEILHGIASVRLLGVVLSIAVVINVGDQNAEC